MATSKNAHLYGQPRPRKTTTSQPITSSNAFSAALSSLISTPSSTSDTTHGRPRKSKTKDDIFTTHNRNAKKRAAADMAAYEIDTQAKLANGGTMDEVSYKRAKRKMDEKARLYAAMKRGDVEDENERHMVDFDRKWAEREAEGKQASETSSDEDGGEEEELVEFTDEFGRARKGTRGEAAREQRRQQMQHKIGTEADRYAPRPNAPSGIIYGDTIQADAFNPDEMAAAQMADLSKKRDTDTPPPEEHYDAQREVRNKGTGFFQFSKDEEERKKQMEELEKERLETERARAEKARDDKKGQRRREIEERRQLIREKREKVQADRFLEDLGQELAQGNDSKQFQPPN